MRASIPALTILGLEFVKALLDLGTKGGSLADKMLFTTATLVFCLGCVTGVLYDKTCSLSIGRCRLSDATLWMGGNSLGFAIFLMSPLPGGREGHAAPVSAAASGRYPD